MRDGTFVIEDVLRGHWGALEREKYIKQWADSTRDSLERTSVRFTVVVEQEPGSGGKESAEATIRNLAGHICIADKPGAGRSKELRAEPFAAQVQGGNVWLPWTMDCRKRRATGRRARQRTRSMLRRKDSFIRHRRTDTADT